MGDITTAVAKQDRSPAATLRDAIKRSEQQFALALPQHVDQGRFIRSALTALNTVPKLAECTQQSVLAGLMQAAQLGLEVSDVQGQAFLIPRKNRGTMQATFQLGYRGMIDLAARAGITVDVDTICENDTYDFERGTQPHLRHRPTLEDRGAPIAYYAVAHFADGRMPAFRIMSRGEVEKHRDRFAASQGGPWSDHFDSMARKTVIRQLLNYLPTSPELRQQVIEAEVSAVDGAPVVPIHVDIDTGEINADPIAAIDTTGDDAA